MILAYHAVGTGRFESSGDFSMYPAAALFDKIAAEGVLWPASHRLQRAEMENRCFDPKHPRGQPFTEEFRLADPNALKALTQMARDVTRTLPVHGDPHTKFTCLDLLAGDLDLIFMTVDRWFGNIQNGFVFDAEELVRNGARVRSHDVIDDIHLAIDEVCHKPFKTVSGAKRSLSNAIHRAVSAATTSGEAALEEIAYCAQHPPCSAELVWRGPLTLDAAVEAWRDGVRI
jgi:hypothetical protein